MIGECISILAVHSVICSLGGPLSHGSPVVVFLDRGHPNFQKIPEAWAPGRKKWHTRLTQSAKCKKTCQLKLMTRELFIVIHHDE